MKREEEIFINKYGQGLVSNEELQNNFKTLDLSKKRDFLTDMIFVIMQSKPNDNDIEVAILESKLKSTFTPCILLKKGVASHNLTKIIELPEDELNKALLLFLSLFKIAYQRRFNLEKNNPDKWWYWDLSDELKLDELRKIKD